MIASQIFSSIGIGSLIGILMGLSASPVVALVVAPVTALLASLIGIKFPKKEEKQASSEASDQERQKLIGIRAGFFGLACVLGIFVGIYMRTHDVLSPPQPSLKQQVEELVSIGLTSKQAVTLVVGNISTETTNESTSKNTVLFAIDSTTCEKIAVDRFENTSAALSYYRTLEQPHLIKIAAMVDQQVSAEIARKNILTTVVEALCAKN